MTNTENVNENHRLVELRGSGYEMVKGEPDIRGWEVKDSQGRLFGKVDEVLFDKDSQKVRYIVLNLKTNELNLKSRKVLIPIGLAKLDDNNDDVIFPEVTAIHLTELPEYKKVPVTYDDEMSARNIFAGLGAYGTGALSDTNRSEFLSSERSTFYEHKHFDDNYLHQSRPSSSSERPIGSSAGENFTGDSRSAVPEQPLNAQEGGIARPASSTDLKSFEEGTIEFTEKKEVPVITKEAKVVEEISLNKEVEEHDATVKETVCKTDIDIERNDPPDDNSDRVKEG